MLSEWNKKSDTEVASPIHWAPFYRTSNLLLPPLVPTILPNDWGWWAMMMGYDGCFSLVLSLDECPARCAGVQSPPQSPPQLQDMRIPHRLSTGKPCSSTTSLPPPPPQPLEWFLWIMDPHPTTSWTVQGHLVRVIIVVRVVDPSVHSLPVRHWWARSLTSWVTLYLNALRSEKSLWMKVSAERQN